MTKKLGDTSHIRQMNRLNRMTEISKKIVFSSIHRVPPYSSSSLHRVSPQGYSSLFFNKFVYYTAWPAVETFEVILTISTILN